MSYNFLFYYNNHTIHLHIGPILMHVHKYSWIFSFSIGQFNETLDFKIHIVILFPPCSISKKTVLKFIQCSNLCFESQTRNIYNYSFIAITIIGILLFIWKLPVLRLVAVAAESVYRENAHTEKTRMPRFFKKRFFQTCS